MTQQQSTELASIRKTVTVRADQQRAFTVYTAGFASWWPPEHHIGKTDMATASFEPRAGGRWYETDVDGTECDWGQVLVWEPPHRIVYTWQLQGDWRFDPDVSHGSEIEVRFIAEGPNRTRVEVEHRHFERHGDGAEAVIRGVSSPDGHDYVLRCYVAKVDAG